MANLETLTRVGALTTVFTEAPTCSGNFIHDGGPASKYTGVDRNYFAPDCWPTSFFGYGIYYSPGICPLGWTSYDASSIYHALPTLAASESVAFCCPSGYTSSITAVPPYAGLFQADCTSVLTAAVSAVSCGACTSRFSVPSSYPGAGIVTATAIPVFIRYQSSDQQVIVAATGQNSGRVTAPATSAGGVTASTTSGASFTATPSGSRSSETLQTSTGSELPNSPAASSSSVTDSSISGGGISTGAKIGIGVGCGVLGIIIILLMVFIWRRRRNHRDTTKIDEDLPYPELDGNPQAEKELELQGSSVYPAEFPEKSAMTAVRTGMPNLNSSELPTENFSEPAVEAGGTAMVEAPSSIPNSNEKSSPTRTRIEQEMPAHLTDVSSNDGAHEMDNNVVQPPTQHSTLLSNLEPPSELPANTINKQDITVTETPNKAEEAQHGIVAVTAPNVADVDTVANLRAEQARLQEERRRIIRLQELDQQEAEIERKLRDVIPDA